MILSRRPIFRLLPVALVIAFLPACSGCDRTPQAPTERAVRYLEDPYADVPARGSLSDLERAAQVLEATGKQLGYGDAPARALRARGTESWARRHALLLAAGSTRQIRVAWQDMVDTWTLAPLPQELKFELHMGLGRVWDLEIDDKTEERVLRHAYLAELAYGYALLMSVPAPEARASQSSDVGSAATGS